MPLSDGITAGRVRRLVGAVPQAWIVHAIPAAWSGRPDGLLASGGNAGLG